MMILARKGGVIGGVKFLLIVFILIGCSNSNNESKFINENTFITSKGTYYFNGLTLKMSELDSGCLIFSLKRTKQDNILIYGDIFRCFNKHQKWCLYIDKSGDLWFYNSDYQQTYVWVAHQNYKKYDYVIKKIKPPMEFTLKL